MAGQKCKCRLLPAPCPLAECHRALGAGGMAAAGRSRCHSGPADVRTPSAPRPSAAAPVALSAAGRSRCRSGPADVRTPSAHGQMPQRLWPCQPQGGRDAAAARSVLTAPVPFPCPCPRSSACGKAASAPLPRRAGRGAPRTDLFLLKIQIQTASRPVAGADGRQFVNERTADLVPQMFHLPKGQGLARRARRGLRDPPQRPNWPSGTPAAACP